MLISSLVGVGQFGIRFDRLNRLKAYECFFGALSVKTLPGGRVFQLVEHLAGLRHVQPALGFVPFPP